jgi:hypothetical protein
VALRRLNARIIVADAISGTRTALATLARMIWSLPSAPSDPIDGGGIARYRR